MSTRMRFRTDAMTEAHAHALVLRGENPDKHLCECGDASCPYDPANFKKVPPAMPGDTWRSTWYGSEALAGYWICCPKCLDPHPWTSATNCGSRREIKDADGKLTGYTCDHSGKGSCWDWSGSAEDNQLTGRPSLLCHTCGFHGFLTNGELVEC